MNYRHIYHAGNFSDVFKHNLLIALLEHLKHKETPFCYLETHAGAGGYHLFSEQAAKTKEFQQGIGRLMKISPLPPPLEPYMELILHFNKHCETINYYPGSPCLAHRLLRPQDRAIFIELHPEDFSLLKRIFLKEKQVAVHYLDGYQGVKAFLPPKEHRGLVFMDPPFERENEFDQLVKGLQIAYQRWPQGILALWYPIKERKDIHSFHRKIKELQIKKILVAELCIFPDDTSLRLNGSGMIIVNPPWQFDQHINFLLSTLLHILSDNPYRKMEVKWLVKE